jgi:Mg2+/Co2+ transporter CorB
VNTTLSGIIILVFGIIASFLSASETAVTMSSRLRLHHLAKKGHERASMLLSLQEQMNTLISTILLINTCLFAGMTTLFTQFMAHFLGDWGIFLSSLVMGAFITLYIEVLPKIYAYQSPEKVALFLAPMLKLLRNFLSPITRLMDFIARKSLQFFRVKISSEPKSTEELRGAIDLHMGEGPIPHERAMLRSILDLSRVTVEEIMVHRKSMISFNSALPPKELCQKILGSLYARIPLWKDSPDNIVGVVMSKNLAQILQNQSKIDFETLMQPPWFIPNTSTLFAQLQLFKEKHNHLAFVVDEYGSLLGMVTLEDILEEIVGEITDEHDVELPGVRLVPNGDYLIRGSVTLRDLHRQYDWEFDESNASTLAGLILNETRSIPEVGDVIVIKGFSMKILRKMNHQLTLVRVTAPQPRV